MGDSISAHFHIPEEWMGEYLEKIKLDFFLIIILNIDATKINAAAFEHLAFILENELDWPETSGITGF